MFIFTPPSLPGDKRSAVNKRTIVIELYRMPAMETESDKLAVEFTRKWQNYCNIEFGLLNKLLSD